MKATFNGNKYRNAKGNLVFTYIVTGTAKEVKAYIAAQAAARNIPEAEVTKDDKGNPLYFFSPNVRAGRIAEKTFILVVTHNGKVVIDDTAKEMNEQQEDRLLFRQERAKLWAQMDVNGQRSTTVAAPAAPKVDVLDEEPATELQQLQTQPAGTEKLED